MDVLDQCLDEEKEDIGREMDMELETLHSLSPRAISLLTGIVDSQETHADAAVDARKRIPQRRVGNLRFKG